MKVGQVIELTKEWVETEGRRRPGFQGAHLMGSMTTMPRDAPFAPWRDIDLSIVVPDGSGRESGKQNLELPYRGLILEVAFHELECYSSTASILSDPRLASDLAVDSILSDPKGMLRTLHKAVARDYARRKWVLIRCEWEKQKAMQCLEAMAQADSSTWLTYHLIFGLGYLAGLLSVARLEMPTHRRCLIMMRELLEPHGKLDLCEAALQVLGCAHMTRPQVEAYLQEMARAIDRAVALRDPQTPYSHKLRSHLRPYFIEGAREMISGGYHREAMWWIWMCHSVANMAIQNDAPEDEKPRFQVVWDRLMAGLGVSTPEDWTARVEQMRDLAEEIFQVADEIVAQNPEIVD